MEFDNTGILRAKRVENFVKGGQKCPWEGTKDFGDGGLDGGGQPLDGGGAHIGQPCHTPTYLRGYNSSETFLALWYFSSQ